MDTSVIYSLYIGLWFTSNWSISLNMNIVGSEPQQFFFLNWGGGWGLGLYFYLKSVLLSDSVTLIQFVSYCPTISVTLSDSKTDRRRPENT